MGSPALANLPTEILTLIFNTFCLHCHGAHHQPCGLGTLQQHQLQWQGQQETQEQNSNHKSWYSLSRQPLLSLCLVSERIRDVAQPILHHEFVPGYGDSGGSPRYSWGGRLASFTRTVAQRWDLARHVRVVSIHPRLLNAVEEDEARTALIEGAHSLGIDLLSAWTQRKPDSRDEEWLRNFPRFLELFLNKEAKHTPQVRRRLTLSLKYPGSPGQGMIATELVAVLIAQLPNLNRLSFQEPCIGESCQDSFPPSALPYLSISNLPLKTLDFYIPALPIIEMATGLETLNLQKCDFPGPLPPLPNLKVIRIANLNLSKSHLQTLLSSCTGNLRTFVYEATLGEWSEPRRSRHGDNQFRLSEAVTLLRPHRHSLQTLHLDLRAQSIVEYSDEAGELPKSNLKDFTALENLLLSTNAITIPTEKKVYKFDSLVQHLPSSIISLHLPHGHSLDWVCPDLQLLCLANQMKLEPREFPGLQRVVFDIEHMFNDDTVRSMFAEVGVDFDYDSWPRSTCVDTQSMMLRAYEAEMSCHGSGLPLPGELSDDDL